MRQHQQLIVPVLLLGAGVLLAGCANDAGPTGTTPSSQSTGTELSISIKADGKTQSAQYHLSCSGSSSLEASDHPRAAEACLFLAAEPQMLTLPTDDNNRVCTMQYGGPAAAEVTGTVKGRTVARTFNLSNGCGIADWTAALPLLVERPNGQSQ
ncbi:hypothetical protein CGQ24_17795 [Arthrobacter sp. 7749]|nr:hypothetical protein CGQ24_17795 [Arthrobacter sp. 7749]